MKKIKWYHVTVTGWCIFTRMIRKILSVELTWTKAWMGSSGGSDSKESACNVGNESSIPGWGRSHGEENGYPLQYSCLENSMDREVRQKLNDEFLYGKSVMSWREEWVCHVCVSRSQKLDFSGWVEEDEVWELTRGQKPWGLTDHGRDFRFFFKFQLENNCFTMLC